MRRFSLLIKAACSFYQRLSPLTHGAGRLAALQALNDYVGSLQASGARQIGYGSQGDLDEKLSGAGWQRAVGCDSTSTRANTSKLAATLPARKDLYELTMTTADGRSLFTGKRRRLPDSRLYRPKPGRAAPEDETPATRPLHLHLEKNGRPHYFAKDIKVEC